MTNLPLSKIDAVFTNQYKNLLETQRNVSESLKDYEFDLSGNEMTNAIYERMMAFWYFHVSNCKDLDRHVNTTAADYFTETCLFFLKPCLKQYGLKVVSEKDIRNDKSNTKVIRPDISIWKEEELVAVIELKVSDGWKGKNMISHLEERKISIKNIWPNVFFGAISFWNCFGDDNKTEDSEYIGLYEIAKDFNHKSTGKTIEKIITRAIRTTTT